MANPRKMVCTLGTANYAPKVYEGNGQVSQKTWEYPIGGLCELYRPTEIVVLCTPETVEVFETAKLEIEDWLGENSPLISAQPIVFSGESEGLDSIVNALQEISKPGESIHLDVTMGIRATATATLLVSAFLERVEGPRIDRFTYIDALRKEENDQGVAIARVLDLTGHLHVPRLLAGVDALERTGDIRGLAEALASAFPSEFGPDDVETAFTLQELLELVRTERISSRKTRSGVTRRIRQVLSQKAEDIPLLEPVARRVEELLEPLDPGNARWDSPAQIARLTRWYIRHQRPVHSILLMFEALPYLGVVHLLKKKYPLGTERDGPRTSFNGHIEEVRKYLNDKSECEMADVVRDLGDKLKRYRNTVAHAQLGQGSHPPDLSVESIAALVRDFEEFCRRLEEMLS